MNSKTKIDQLISCVSTCESDEYPELLSELNLKSEDFKTYINFSNEKYVRNCIAKGDNFELILICWHKDQLSAIHGHDGNEGWIYVLQGEFEEKRYHLNSSTKKLELQHKKTIGLEEICHTSKNLKEFHSIENISAGKSISLHLYKNPIEKCKVYNNKTGKLTQHKLSYDFKKEAIFL